MRVRYKSALVVALLALVALAALLGSRPDPRLANMSGVELAEHIRKREPDRDHAIKLIIPHARTEGGEIERQALVHALSAGPGVTIYEPAAEALEAVGPIAIRTLRASLDRERPWMMRYAVIMLGRLARSDDEESITALKRACADRPGGYHIDSAVDRALQQIAGYGTRPR